MSAGCLEAPGMDIYMLSQQDPVCMKAQTQPQHVTPDDPNSSCAASQLLMAHAQPVNNIG